MYIEYNTRVKSLIDNQILKIFTDIQTLVMLFQCVYKYCQYFYEYNS